MRTGDTGIKQLIDKNFVAIGHIVKTHGIKGEVKVAPLTDMPGRYNTLKKVYIHTRIGERREYSIKRVTEVKSGLVIEFSPHLPASEAEEIVGGYLTIHESEVPKLGKDSYYHFELIDMEVCAEDGRYLGRISDILSTGSNDVYIVKDGVRDYLIPAIHDVVKDVDIKGKRMVISIIEGLIDV